MSDAIAAEIRFCTRAEHRRAVAAWHSHHKPALGEVVALGAYVAGALVAALVISRPVAPALAREGVLEVTRLAVGPDAPDFTASRLLGAAWRVARGGGCRRMVSYTRQDEPGTCYRAAGWVATALVEGDTHTHGNRAGRWLPGLYVPSTEIVDRVRWEIGPGAASTRVDIKARGVRGKGEAA